MRRLEAGFAEAHEHIGLVGFDAGLIKGIDALKLRRNSARKLEEIDERAERTGGKVGGFDFEDGDAARAVRGDSGVESVLVNKTEVLTGEIVQTIKVLNVGRNGKIGRWGLLEFEHGFKNVAAAFLEILTKRVKVGRIDDGGWEDSLVLFALGFAEKLLPPFFKILKLRLESREDFDVVAARGEFGAGGGVFYRGSVRELVIKSVVIFRRGTGEQVVDVDTSDSERQKTDRAKNRVATADIVRDDEAGVFFLESFVVKSTTIRVGRGVDASASAIGAVFLDEFFFQEAEGDGGFGRGARFRDDVDREISVAESFQKFVESERT